MKRIVLQMHALGLIIVSDLPTISSSASSQRTRQNPNLQQKIASVNQSVAQNQHTLLRYRWTESQETILEDETTSIKQSQCRYGSDGKMQQTVLTSR
jgi:hypothetical protein